MAVDADKQAEIDTLRASTAATRRATVPALESLLYEPLPVLDQGFIRIIDYMGDDAAIVQAARVSYGRGTKQISGDRGLINYLMRHRQFYLPDREILHLEKAAKRTVPEQQDIFGVPKSERLAKHTAAQSTINKQGRDEVLEADAAAGVLREIGAISSRSFTVYEKLLGDDEHPGIARELARMVLPLNTYTQWYWKIDLHNLLHFMRLRHDSHAQYEIRAYAEVLLDITRKWVPLAAAAFDEYRAGAAELSSGALGVIR